MLLNDPRTSGGIANEIGLVLDPGRYVRNQAKIMESPQVAQRASEILDDGTTAADVEDALVASSAANLDAVIVQATMPTANGSVDVANAVVAAYEEVIAGQVQRASQAAIDTLELSRTETEARISELDAALAENPDDSVVEAQRAAAINQLIAVDTRIEQIATNAALYGSGVQLYVAPDTPTAPVQPRPRRNAAIGIVFGLLLGGTWAWRRAERHQHRRRPERHRRNPRCPDAGGRARVPTIQDRKLGTNRHRPHLTCGRGVRIRRLVSPIRPRKGWRHQRAHHIGLPR